MHSASRACGGWAGSGSHHFGIEAFGINAYTADQAGDRVIEEHDEIGGGGPGRHQELYIVLTGRATFTVDGDELDAPAGTFVFIGEPDVRRGAVVAKGWAGSPTTVIAIGGRPGEPFTGSPWEYSFRGLAKGGPEGAAAFEEGIARFPDSPSLPYNLARLRAREGDRTGAITALHAAIALTARAREWAAGDSDFDALRGDEEFEALLRE
jgi:hypothetical protein